MNVCKVPDMYKDMEYKYITEDSKTRVYLSVVREFNEAEYEKYYIRKKKEKVRKRILFIARALKYALPVLASTILYNMLSNKLYLERGSYEIGSEIVFVGIFGIALFGFHCGDFQSDRERFCIWHWKMIMQGCKSGYHRCLEWKAVRISISLQNLNRSMTDWKNSL